MRVLHLIESLGRAGAERIALQLSGGMVAAGWASEVTALQARDEFPDYSAVTRTFLVNDRGYRWPLCVPTAVRRLRRRLAEWRPDIVEIHSPAAAMAFAFAGSRVPAVQVLHGPDVSWGAAGRWGRHRGSLELRRWAASKMRMHVAVSRGLARAARMILGVPPARLRCVYNGIDTEHFAVGGDREIPSRPVFLVLGSLVPRKRPGLALRALQAFTASGREAELWFSGDGPLRQLLEKETERLGLAARVRFLGVREDVSGVLAQASLVWQFSAAEGLSLALLEAMAAGVPVIATAIVGNAEAVQDGVTGWLFPTAEPLQAASISEQLLRAPGLYQEMAGAARRHVTTRFSLERMTQEHMKALSAAVAA